MHKAMNHAINRVPTILMAATILTGCVGLLPGPIPFARDISKRPEYWGAFKSQATYVLLDDVFLQTENRLGKILVLTTSRNLRMTAHWPGPPSVAEYNAAPSKWPNVHGVVTKGTRIKAVELKSWPGQSGKIEDGTVNPIGEIIDGPFKGEKPYLTDLLDYQNPLQFKESELTLPVPHPQFLREVTQ